MAVGLELRQARERRGLTVRQLSDITKISPRMLQAIDDGDESRLPAPVYTRAFVKTYAREVALDPDETMRRYMAQFEPRVEDEPQLPEVDRAPAARRAHPIQRVAELVQGPLAGPLAIALVVVILAAIGLKQRDAPSDPISVAVPGASAAEPATAPRPDTPVGTTGQSPANALHLAIAPTGPCWMRATVDRSPLFATLLTAGEHRTIDARSEVTLRIGDVSSCAFTINGNPARIPGAPGQAVTVRVTPDNYRQFLAR
jgi:cytoskeleton protein RodZ